MTCHAGHRPDNVTTWQMWVPQASASLLAVVRRSPGAQHPGADDHQGHRPDQCGFHQRDVVFLSNLHAGNPVGIGARSRRPAPGMLLAVGVWTIASMSHAGWRSLGFALARAVLGLGEGGTFPGGLRTAVETLPANLRARGIALSFSGGTIGAVMMPLLLATSRLIRLENRVHGHWRSGDLAADLGGHRAAAIPAEEFAHDLEAGVAESP